ncbi:hypothetical protein PFICI_00302 [Pestalotiopsis fici W106-1]|uniref:Uncharacterized protein n=1 Tax=Pestalotiopsis fici (strain W106-1 / CGMCC3.15140) TaxID=1229662 RepID=W3XKD1_PESFW|nr:uncharacterized protein PFICI_00302 [Pestalotiopsis fici W106-1]ETS86474.1 hypothetical protein PFICI_00302 [Pestalotiopsis fici W106-1]
MSSAIKATRAPPGMSSWTENELSYIDGDRYSKMISHRVALFSFVSPVTDRYNLDLDRIRHYTGGVEIYRRGYDGLKVAIPSRLAAELGSLMFRANNNCIGGNTPRERSRWALKETMSKYRGDRVLLDITSGDEDTLRHITAANDIEMGDLLCQNPAVLPKAYKNWAPNNTEMNISPNGFRVVFRDSSKRDLMKVIYGDYKEANPDASKSSSGLRAPAGGQIHKPGPLTPQKRKAADPQHKDRTKAALSQISRDKGFKQQKTRK